MAGSDTGVMSNMFNDPGTALQMAGLVMPKYTYYGHYGSQLIPHTIDIRPGLEGLGGLYTQQKTLSDLQKGGQMIPGMLNQATTALQAPAPPPIQGQYNSPSAGMELASAGNVPTQTPDLAAQAKQLVMPEQLPQLKDFLTKLEAENPGALRAYYKTMTTGGTSPLETQFNTMRGQAQTAIGATQAAKMNQVAADALTRLRDNPQDENARNAYTSVMFAAGSKGMTEMQTMLKDQDKANANMDLAEQMGHSRAFGLTAPFAAIAEREFVRNQDMASTQKMIEDPQLKASMPATEYQTLLQMAKRGPISSTELYTMIKNPQTMQQEAQARQEFPQLWNAYAHNMPMDQKVAAQAAMKYPLLQPVLQKMQQEMQQHYIQEQLAATAAGQRSDEMQFKEKTLAWNETQQATLSKERAQADLNKVINDRVGATITNPQERAKYEAELTTARRVYAEAQARADEAEHRFGVTFDQSGYARRLQSNISATIQGDILSNPQLATPEQKLNALNILTAKAQAKPALTDPEFKLASQVKQFLDQQILRAQNQVRTAPGGLTPGEPGGAPGATTSPLSSTSNVTPPGSEESLLESARQGRLMSRIPGFRDQPLTLPSFP